MPMKKTRRSPRRVWKRETWGRKRAQPYKVLVARDRNKRFITWYKIRPKPPTKTPPRRFAKITYEEHEAPSRREARAYERYRELYRKPHGNPLSVYGTARIKKGRTTIIQQRRWELYHPSGMTTQEWRNAVGHAKRHPPNQPQKHIYADDIAGEYEGEWIDTPEIESA